ncbi:hypothetical protein JR316_0002530 [Psilocybe cubensis]|uniref:Uncharacterized protein n=1 Tax=Psilocybe cubensis TaxID=181762 RepID=A0ACB8HCA2_PSICU|nr:hypothetical protein JR316_0002530 [Psilocybe cubensis]KAH9485620.1 hypothetical protein JR316_0002530 [Psilocybe cubensis]
MDRGISSAKYLVYYYCEQAMKFFIVFSALLASASTVLASPAEDTTSSLQFAQDGTAPNGCHWEGTAPFCAGSCAQGYTEIDRGGCGDGACCITGIKTLCCTQAAAAAAKKKIANAKPI